MLPMDWHLSLLVLPPNGTRVPGLHWEIVTSANIWTQDKLEGLECLDITTENSIALNTVPQIPTWKSEEYKTFNLPENSDKYPLANEFNSVLILILA